MIHHIYIYFLLLICVFAAVSCKKQKTPDFHDSDSMLVLQTCEAIAQGNEAEVMRNLDLLKQSPTASTYTQEIELSIKRYFDTARMNQLIDNGDFQELKNFINVLRSRGDSSTELLENSEIPEALQELTLFCAKMPWENADSLELALSQLAPYKESLALSPSFQNFITKQEALLKHMRQDENEKKLALCLSKLETAALTANEAEWQAARQNYLKLQPNSPLPTYEKNILQGKKTSPHDTNLYAIAILGSWNKLNSRQRNLALQYSIICKTGNCADVLALFRHLTTDNMLAYISKMKQQNLLPAKIAIQTYTESLTFTQNKKIADNNRTNNNTLGLKEVFDFCSSITINQTTGN